jgi:hypothetical protein
MPWVFTQGWIGSDSRPVLPLKSFLMALASIVMRSKQHHEDFPIRFIVNYLQIVFL